MPSLPEYLPSVALPPDYARYRLLAEGQHRLSEQTYQMLVQYESQSPGRWPNKVYSRHYICLDEQGSGRVVWINGEEYSVYLLNTSYEKFAEMQLLLREETQWLNSWMRSYSEDDAKRYSEEYYQHGREMLATICNVDPEAIEESESWTEVLADVQEPYNALNP